jgi:MFS transporter, FHS family, Na+ dependent glucose transporter 1
MEITSNTLPSPDRGRLNPMVLTAAYYACLMLLGLATSAEGPSLPTLAQHTGSALDRISFVFVADAFGYLVGSLGGGRLYDRLPGHRLMAVMLVLMFAAAIVFPLASVLWLLLLFAFLLGLGKGAVDVGCNTLLQWVHGDRIGPFMNGLHFAYGLGSFLAPLLLAQIILRTHEIYWVFWIISILIVPLAIWLWFLPAPSARRHGTSQVKATVPLVPVMLMVMAFLLYVGAELGFSNWIYTYALTLKLADAITAAYLTSAYWALFTAGRLLGVWVSTRLRSRTVLFIDFTGCLVSLAVIGLAQESAAALWLGSIGLGLSTASIFPTLLILAGERLEVTGTITGWLLVASGAGSMLLPWLIGLAFTTVGPHAMITILFIDMALGLLTLLLFIYGGRLRGERLPAAGARP